MKYINRIKLFLNLLGTSNWYHGVDKPNLYERIYKWRLGVNTSWEVAKIIWD